MKCSTCANIYYFAISQFQSTVESLFLFVCSVMYTLFCLLLCYFMCSLFLWCSDASFGYPGGPLLFKNLNFGIDLDSRIASKCSIIFLTFVIYIWPMVSMIYFIYSILCINANQFFSLLYYG